MFYLSSWISTTFPLATSPKGQVTQLLPHFVDLPCIEHTSFSFIGLGTSPCKQSAKTCKCQSGQDTRSMHMHICVQRRFRSISEGWCVVHPLHDGKLTCGPTVSFGAMMLQAALAHHILLVQVDRDDVPCCNISNRLN